MSYFPENSGKKNQRASRKQSFVEAKMALLQCYNKGCGQKFDPLSNTDGKLVFSSPFVGGLYFEAGCKVPVFGRG